MRDTADEFDSGLAKWFGGKKAGEELRGSADDIDADAKELEDAAKAVQQLLNDRLAAGSTNYCCNQTDWQQCLNELGEEIDNRWEDL